MFGQDRKRLRQTYHDVWLKMQASQPLTALESCITRVIDMHPEYHHMLASIDSSEQEFFVESGQTNPYLHMGLHISLHEQLNTDRPAGIRDIYQSLCHKTGDVHDSEHLMIECLAETLWQSQQNRQPPSEQAYLAALKTLLRQ
jgi:hypothetical protein